MSFQALCSAVEEENLEVAKSILEGHSLGHISVNGVNSDGFTLLDLAFMTGNQALVSLVVHHGGKEGAFFPSPEAVSAHLLGLITESSKQVEKFRGQLAKLMASDSEEDIMGRDQEKVRKQLSLSQKRLTIMTKLKDGFDGAGCPHAPVEVAASVTGSSCINVRVKGPEKTGNSSFTKGKIQWSLEDSFSKVEGEMEVTAIDTFEFNIKNLAEGKRIFIRAACGNPKGYGPFSDSRPRSLVPHGVGQLAKVWLYARNLSGLELVGMPLEYKHWALVIEYLEEEGQVDRQELYEVHNEDGIVVASNMTFSSRLELEWMNKPEQKKYTKEREWLTRKPLSTSVTL